MAVKLKKSNESHIRRSSGQTSLTFRTTGEATVQKFCGENSERNLICQMMSLVGWVSCPADERREETADGSVEERCGGRGRHLRHAVHSLPLGTTDSKTIRKT